MSAVARDSLPSWGRQRTPGWSAGLGQGMSAGPTSDAYLQALRPPVSGDQAGWGARRSGLGDAVTGIKRADSASG